MIYLDYQATAPIDPRVLEAMIPWLTARVGNPHSSTHDAGRAAHHAVEGARRQVATLINADPEEILFASGATEATNLALRGLLRKGDLVVTSTIEHSCVRDTLENLHDSGIKISEVPVNAEALIDVEAFASKLADSPRLATVMAANNEVGTIQPIATLGATCRQANVLFHTDAAQAAGKIALDVADMRIDMMSISSHKLYGPQGIGALYCRNDVRNRLKPITTGGGQERGLRPGTVPVALCVGFGEACSIAATELEQDRVHSLRLRSALLDLLTDRIGKFQVNGSLDDRLPGNLNIWFEDVDAEALLAGLPDVAMSMGSACSSASIAPSHVLLAMGLSAKQAESSVRIGFGRGTSVEDIKRAVERIAEEVSRLRLSAVSPKVDRTAARNRHAAS